MKQDDGPMRKSNDPKGSGGPNFLLYAGIAGVGVVLVAVLLVNQHRHEIAFPVLQQLLRASKFKSLHSENTGELALNPETGEQYPGKLEISEQRNGQTFTVEYSRLSNLEVSPTEVRGSLQVRTLRPETSALRTENFRTQLGESEAWKEGLQLLLSNNNIDYRNVPTSPWRAWAPVLFFSLILLVFLVLMLRRIGGAGSPMQFGRSRGKLYAMEDLGVTFDDVAGINEAVEEVRELVDFLQSPEKYQRLGGRIPKGVLLVGPPGTGKTLLAKAIAGEAGVPFYSLSGSDFVEMFVGVGAARVRDMFQQAESKAPCIIFIDELDALGKSRGAGMIGGHDEREQTLNALLVEMDGFDSNAAVIVMAATNRPETLDQALLRPGRFDRHVLVDRPDIQGREDILKVHVKNVKLDNSIDLKEVAGITPGFVGADLANLVNEAALLAARNEKDFVGIHEFNEGVERVTAGLEKKQRVMRREEKERVAYHESGHALVAFSLPNTDPVHKVSIIPRGLAALGYTLQRPEDERFLVTKLELESQIQILLAGTITEEIIYRDISSGAQNDLERATDIARRMVMEYGMSDLGRVNYRAASSSAFLPAGQDEESSRRYSEQTSREIDTEVKRIIDEAIEQVRHILDVRYDALIAVTTRLIEVESIGAKELREIIEKTSPGPVIVPGTDATVDPAPSQRPVDNRSRTEQSG
ncbi:MAG TPA: cell division protein FtsH [Planctomycetaceae bacterium]|nr:cell division protein FtsH [Planctomycetaceae bacterium]|tara:strand:+ start:12311 stop:14404 length:2094 start_codon:yes stop_codon:yes gene_type:complete